MDRPKTLDDPETYAVIGAAMAVHTELGCGFLETVYKAALAAELRDRSIPFAREVGYALTYKGKSLGLLYRADFICHDSIVVEVKAHEALTPLDLAQTINYLRASGLRRGLLLNFGGTSLVHRRVVFGGGGGRQRTGAELRRGPARAAKPRGPLRGPLAGPYRRRAETVRKQRQVAAPRGGAVSPPASKSA